MDKNWKDWLAENILRGCSLAALEQILLANSFQPDVVKREMDTCVLQKRGHAALPGFEMHNALYNIRLTRIAQSNIARVETPLMQLYSIKNFFNDAECEQLVALISQNLRPSTVTVYVEGFRTSQTCDLGLLKNPFVQSIDQRICAMLGIAEEFAENIQAQQYFVGQEFKQHTDFFEPNTDEYQEHANRRGNRTWTFMIYLNNTLGGGGTHFPHLNRIFYPHKGNALAWNNLDRNGLPNCHTMHSGMPVEQGEKIIITKWFRERIA